MFGPITLGSRLSYLDFDAYQAILYDKSAIVLMMLRDLDRRGNFFKGLREFFAAYKYQVGPDGEFHPDHGTGLRPRPQDFFQGLVRFPHPSRSLCRPRIVRSRTDLS